MSGRTSGGNVAAARLSLGAERGVGNSRLVGAVVTLLLVQDAALAGWLPQAVVVGQQLLLRARGVAGQTVTWFGDTTVLIND